MLAQTLGSPGSASPAADETIDSLVKSLASGEMAEKLGETAANFGVTIGKPGNEL